MSTLIHYSTVIQKSQEEFFGERLKTIDMFGAILYTVIIERHG